MSIKELLWKKLLFFKICSTFYAQFSLMSKMAKHSSNKFNSIAKIICVKTSLSVSIGIFNTTCCRATKSDYCGSFQIQSFTSAAY